MTDTVAVPSDKLAEFVLEEVRANGDVRVHAPEGVDVDKWEHIDAARVDDVRYEDGDVHLWMESETTLSRRVARATRYQPDEYVNDPADVLISVTWDLSPDTEPAVDIEVIPE